MTIEMLCRDIKTGVTYVAFYSASRDETAIHMPWGIKILNREQFNERFRYTKTGVIAPKPRQFTHRTKRGG